MRTLVFSLIGAICFSSLCQAATIDCTFNTLLEVGPETSLRFSRELDEKDNLGNTEEAFTIAKQDFKIRMSFRKLQNCGKLNISINRLTPHNFAVFSGHAILCEQDGVDLQTSHGQFGASQLKCAYRK